MSKLTSYNEIMRESSKKIDDYSLSMQFPACDMSGYFLFSGLSGEGNCQAINIGIQAGVPDGADRGNVPEDYDGDPNKVLFVTSSIIDGVSYRQFDSKKYTRSDLTYSRTGLDVQLADVARIKGQWPNFEFYFIDKPNNIIYDIEGTCNYVHWVKNHMQTNTIYSYVLLPDYNFHGTIKINNNTYRINGTGGFDHTAGRIQKSSSSKGVGFWHNDPIMWDNGYISNGLYYLDSEGNPYINSGVMTIPDGGYYPAHTFNIEYLEISSGISYDGYSGNKQSSPRKWKASMISYSGTLTYETTPVIVTNPAGAAIIEQNVAFTAIGEFIGSDGKVTKLKGKGFNEFRGANLELTKRALNL